MKAKLASSKSDIDKLNIANFDKRANFHDKIKNLNEKITSNKTKHVLVENESEKLQTFDSSLFIFQNCFNNGGAQIYSKLQLLYYSFKRLGDTEKVVSWKYKGLSVEKHFTLATTNNSLSSSIIW